MRLISASYRLGHAIGQRIGFVLAVAILAAPFAALIIWGMRR